MNPIGDTARFALLTGKAGFVPIEERLRVSGVRTHVPIKQGFCDYPAKQVLELDMLDGAQDASRVVWGYPVPRKLNGRHMWPEQIKVMAAERVAAGATVAEIARELSASESLVGRWVRNSREDKPARRAKAEPALGVVEAIGVYDPPKPAAEAGSCTTQIGDIQLTIGPG